MKNLFEQFFSGSAGMEFEEKTAADTVKFQSFLIQSLGNLLQEAD